MCISSVDDHLQVFTSSSSPPLDVGLSCDSFWLKEWSITLAEAVNVLVWLSFTLTHRARPERPLVPEFRDAWSRCEHDPQSEAEPPQPTCRPLNEK